MNVINEFQLYLEENYDTDGEKNTIKAYISDIQLFIKFFKEHYDEDIVDFSRANIIEFKKYMTETMNFKYSTINRKIASISIYENFLIEKQIRKEPNKIVKKSDFYKIDRSLITAAMLPRKTLKKIMLKAGEQSKRDYAMFVLLHEGGFRVSELLNIKLRDVNFETFYITISGKGKKVRHIIINSIMYDAITDYLPEREKSLEGRNNKYLFVSNKTANTNKPMCRTSINNLLKYYCIEIHEDKVNPHIFRHDCATIWYEEGCSDMMLKKFLGQSSNITDIYTHPGGEKIMNNKNKDKK